MMTPGSTMVACPHRVGVLVPLVLVTAVGCGPGPAPDTAANPASTVTASAEPAEPGSEDGGQPPASAGSCHPKCAGWLTEARSLLAKADGLGDAPNVAVVYGQSGDAFARAWRGCDLREPTAEDLACEGAATAVSDMARAYEKAERPDGAVLAALVASDARWKRASAAAGAAASHLAELASAAEKTASADPKAPKAAEALAAAVYAWLGAGDLAAAERVAALYRRTYGAKETDEPALQAAAIALAAGKGGDWGKALATLNAAGQPTRAKQARTKILWHAAHGRALEAAGKAAQASGDYEKVLGLWGEQGPSDVALLVGHANPRPMLDRESVVEAVGEAHLHHGNRVAARAAEAAMPAYRGPATVVGVNDFVKGALAEWIGKRQQAVAEAERHFARIAAIRPVPPARPMMLGRRSMARAWTDFANAFDVAKPPKHVADDAELASAWSASMGAATEKLRANAQTELDACTKLAARLELDSGEKPCVVDDAPPR